MSRGCYADNGPVEFKLNTCCSCVCARHVGNSVSNGALTFRWVKGLEGVAVHRVQQSFHPHRITKVCMAYTIRSCMGVPAL